MRTSVIWVLFILSFVVTNCVNERLKNEAFDHANNVINGLDSPTAYDFFPEEDFPEDYMRVILFELREKCEYKKRTGKFVDDFYERALGHDLDKVTFIYEYFLKCDSVRFILKYELDKEPRLIKFRIEPIESENPMILNKSKQLIQK